MYVLSTAAALLLGTAMASPFRCNSSKASGFSPKCCTDINGQVGVNCIGAHIIGVTNTYYECNLQVYNITGCCQTTGYQNPITNNTLDLCSMYIDPV